MKLVFSTDEIKFVRRRLEGYKKSCVIDVRDIMEELGYSEGDEITEESHVFVINREIEKKLTYAINNKKIEQIVYFNYNISKELVDLIKGKLIDFGVDEDIFVILFDNEEAQVALWTHFDEIKK